MNIVRRTIGVTAVGAVLVGLLFVTPALAGKNKTTRWHTNGFACLFNNDGSSNCRFEVRAKNRTDERGPHICYVVVKFTNIADKWESYTRSKNLRPKQTKTYHTTAEQVPEGSIVKSWRARCYRVDFE